ncbi:cobalt-precorrin-6A reductase [Acidisoma silvae]|uniref:Cobalt-precorrin-6A reductase n=1 Tax=Acidisoma silvae TaxID=2802396 RepID=A0A963YRB5_9PROT|nr:cobalt-precorrin-6A reductase [Acidisoma silvae]MCB8875696.1 cobalt-precorrin-6A reductase [Acidisoma silvae]
MRVLILGGTTEASGLARLLAVQEWVAPVLSFAGRTASPVLPPIPHRIGGFGGVAGLDDYLRAESVDLLIDATHPFANQISTNAAQASEIAGIPRLVLQRSGWQPVPGDDWRMVTSVTEAARAIGAKAQRVFLTIGRQDLLPFRDLAPQHDYLIRSVDTPDPALLPPHAEIVTGRGPFDAEAERALLKIKQSQIVVTKNSGGADGKLEAARALGLPVIMVARQAPPPGETVETPAEALAWISAHAGRAPAERGPVDRGPAERGA